MMTVISMMKEKRDIQRKGKKKIKRLRAENDSFSKVNQKRKAILEVFLI